MHRLQFETMLIVVVRYTEIMQRKKVVKKHANQQLEIPERFTSGSQVADQMKNKAHQVTTDPLFQG